MAGLRRLATPLLVLVVLYGASYGVARWQKLIVMAECLVGPADLDPKALPIVRQTQPGFDVRTDWRGQAKNHVSGVVFAVFRPICALEDLMRGGSTASR
jgi:hypothetical protein